MKRTLALAITLLLPAPVAVADEVQFGWRTLMEYDSEMISTAGGGLDDFIFTMGPQTEISGEHRRLNYNVQHFSGYEKYLDLTGFDAWRHEIRGSVGYEWSPQLRLNLTESFTVLPRRRTGTDEEDVDDAFNVDAGETRTNVFSAGATWVPVPRLTATANYSNIFREFDDPTINSQNTKSNTLLNQVMYQLSESHSIGSGFRYSHRDFETGLDDDNQTETFEAFGIWQWEIDSRSTFSMRAGPSWSEDDNQDVAETSVPSVPRDSSGAFFIDWATCPAVSAGGVPVPVLLPSCSTLPQAALSEADQAILEDEALFPPTILDVGGQRTDDNDINLYFALTLDRRWDRFDASASWIRSDSQTQSLGSSTIVDTLLLRSRYHITPRLRLSGSFRFTRRFSDVERESFLVVLDDAYYIVPFISAAALSSAVVGSANFDTSFEQTRDSYNVRVRLSRDWGRYSSAFVGFAYRKQENEFDSVIDDLDTENETDSWQIQLGFTYRFRPIRF